MKVFLILVLVTLISCNKEDINSLLNNDKLASNVAVLNLQGSYQDCSVSASYPGYYQKSNVTFNGLDYEIKASTHRNNDCSDRSGSDRAKYKIVAAGVNPDDSSLMEIDLEMISYEFDANHPWYVSQNYCGLTDWVENEFREITGLNCPSYLNSPHTDSIMAKGEIYYTNFKIEESAIGIASGYDESGLSEQSRHISNMVLVRKI